jgi:hypothetical protein
MGAFTAWRTSAGLSGRCLDGRGLPDTEAVEDAWRSLRKLDDALIQPCLTNHPSLVPLGNGDDAITVRYISRWRGVDAVCLSAVLELPVGPDAYSAWTRYCILPLRPRDGRLLPWPPHAYLSSRDRETVDWAMAQVPDGFNLPDWSALVALTHRAHARFPDLWAIAWDWVLTPRGPVLLEGNPGWSAVMPQMFHGGLLARH